MNSLFFRSARRYLLKHPLQLLLSLIGIALGVAVVIAIDLANSSSSKAFELSMESITGKATHQITGLSKGVPDSLYRYLKINKKVSPVAPVIEKNVAAMRDPVRIFTLIGVDPFAEGPFRSYLASIEKKADGSVAAFLTDSIGVLISTSAASQMNLKENDTLTIKAGGIYKKVRILGLLNSSDEYTSRVLENLMITDVSTAQELLNMNNFISRIDLIIPDNEQGVKYLDEIQSFLPPYASIVRSETRSAIASDMVKAFDINLTALSLLALIVGMFLIYNTMTFSVVQRRNYIGLLRSIGVTQKEVFKIFLVEASILAVIGTVIGIFIGIILAKGILSLVTQTINDLYFVLTVRSLDISMFSILKALALGIGATILAALKPSLEAASVTPRSALSRSEQEIKLKKKIPRLSRAGLLFLISGAIILSVPGRNIILSYTGILPVILGFSLLTPLMITLFIKPLHKVSGRVFGLMGRMATRSIITQISRTAVAVAALSIAVSATVGIGIMVNSFRQTVVRWLEGNLEADIYITPPGLVQRENESTLDSALVSKIIKLPEVEDYNAIREIVFNKNDEQMHLIALKLGKTSYKDFKFKQGNPETVWPEFETNDVAIVTEPFAYRNNTRPGDIIAIPTEHGNKNFKVAGIYYDYASDQGIIAISFNTYKRYWQDYLISGLSLFINKRSGPDSLINYIKKMPRPGEEINVRSSSTLRKVSMEIFDRTFLITDVLQVLAIIVAFIGILSALMALQLERSREFAILRANGLIPSQLWGLLTLQTGIMGLISGVLSLPLGNTLAWILIYIINKRSFGWTLQFIIMPEIIIQALLIALVSAVLAGIYPAIKMSRTAPAFALREE